MKEDNKIKNFVTFLLAIVGGYLDFNSNFELF